MKKLIMELKYIGVEDVSLIIMDDRNSTELGREYIIYQEDGEIVGQQ